jgi:hypothetical protein
MHIEISEDHIYTVDGVIYPSVTQILQAIGFINTQWFTEYGCERGSLVHKIVHWHLTGELDEATIDPVLQGYFEAWKAFERDTEFKTIDAEKPLFSKEYGFVGTPDNIGIMRDLCVLDYKSGSLGPVVRLQLAAYEILAEHPLKRFALQLKEDGRYNLKEFKDRQDRKIFLSALAVYQWQLNNL